MHTVGKFAEAPGTNAARCTRVRIAGDFPNHSYSELFLTYQSLSSSIRDSIPSLAFGLDERLLARGGLLP